MSHPFEKYIYLCVRKSGQKTDLFIHRKQGGMNCEKKIGCSNAQSVHVYGYSK